MSKKKKVSDNDDLNETKEIETLEIKQKRTPWISIGVIAVLVIVIIVLFMSLSDANTETDQANEKIKKTEQTLAETNTNLNNLKADQAAAQTKCTEAQDECEKKIAGLETALSNTKSKFGELKDEKKEAKKELAQFKAFSAKFQRMINSGKLEVNFRRGRMVVDLPAQVLFDSGSAELSEDGMASLKEVAKVLRKVQNKRFIVGGHTDNTKIKKADFKSNWDLSSERALVVTDALIKGGLKPWNLVAAGYAEYAPIASNASEEGRRKNRRIEIILEPYLKEIGPVKSKDKAKGKPKAKSKGKSKKKKGKK